MMFKGTGKFVMKIKKLVKPIGPPHSGAKTVWSVTHDYEPPSKTRKVDMDITNIDRMDTSSNASAVWVQLNHCVLTEVDRSDVQSGRKLNDNHMEFAQKVLKRQFMDSDPLCS